jgi:hypothetical protein
LHGSELQRFSFDEEPGEYRWVLRRVWPDRLRVEILEFSELWSNAPDDEGTVLLRGDCTTKEFALAVVSALDSVLAEHGEAGYKERWGCPFPSQTLRDLKASIDNPS